MTQPCDEPPLVLLVEDDRDSREMYALGLDLLGLRVVQAATAADALRTCVAKRPQVVVTDLTLPDMDGLALCEVLRQEPASASLPILALTGRSGDEDVARATAAGVKRVLVKPCPPDALADAIRGVLGAS
jgi:two-component system CheB/CheR fusion protein